jgi:hypothetical protein
MTYTPIQAEWRCLGPAVEEQYTGVEGSKSSSVRCGRHAGAWGGAIIVEMEAKVVHERLLLAE